MLTQRKNQLLLGVLALGALALLVDRVFVGSPLATPATSTAGEFPPATGPTPGVSVNPTPDKPNAKDGGGLALSIPELPFPRELPALAAGDRIRDVFARPKAGRSDANANGSPGNASDDSETGEPQDRAGYFPQKHRLEAVYLDDGLRIAVVDGAWVAIGDRFDGCVLAAIEGNQATFRCGDRETVLRMDAATPPN